MKQITFSSLILIVLVACSTPPATTSLFNGKDLSGWHMDIPSMDTVENKTTPFIVRDGMLVSLGKPEGHQPMRSIKTTDWKCSIVLPARLATAAYLFMLPNLECYMACFRNPLKRR